MRLLVNNQVDLRFEAVENNRRLPTLTRFHCGVVGNYGICDAQNLALVIASSTPGKDCMSDDAFADDDSDLYKSLRLTKGR